VAGPPCFLGDPVDAGDAVVRRRGSVIIGDKEEGEGGLHVGVRPRALVTQNLHGDDFGGFRNTVVFGNSGSSTVSPMAISIVVGISAKGLSPRGTPFEVRVSGEDTSVWRIQ